NQSGQSTSRFLAGPAWEYVNDTTNSIYRTRALEYTERRLSALQFNGEHYGMFGTGIRLSWLAGISTTRQDEPDLRYFADERSVAMVEDPVTGDLVPSGDYRYVINRSRYQIPSRLWRLIDEDHHEYKADLDIPLGRTTKFKTGVAWLKKERTHDERKFTYRRTQDYSSFNGDADAWAADVGVDTVIVLNETTGRTQWRFDNYIGEEREPQNSYNAEQKVFGTYGMFELPLTLKLSVVAGVRYETTKMTTVNSGSSIFIPDSSSQIDGGDFLPSLNIIYKLQSNMNARVAYGRTLARPTLREMSHAFYDEFGGGLTFLGNPDITYTRIDNYDVRWEWFLRPGEILAISGFYKNFKDPIELTIVDVNGTIGPVNVPKARLYGVELEFRRGLDHVGRFLRYFKLGGNITLVHSEVDIPGGELTDLRLVDPNAKDTRPMVGQSPYVVNLDLAYENPLSGTSLSLLYNVFGERMAFNAQDFTPDVFEQPFHSLDFIASQRVIWNVNLKFSVKNLLNSDHKFTQDYQGKEYITQLYNTGRSFSLGATFIIE
ncbi:MAG: TonB-dependent receptor, partial [Candidatus Zixiibacteriota bacterium]